MRFQEFKVLKELASPLSIISQAADLATKYSNPFSALGISSGNDTSGNTASNLPGDQNIKIGSGGTGSINKNEVSSYLKSKMDDNHRLGILANIEGEPHFQPGVLGDKNTSGGLFQHHNERFTNMVNYVGSDWATDWKNQIDFALSEPEGKQYLATRFRTPEQATEWWVRNFERPKYATSDTNKRIGYLKNFG